MADTKRNYEQEFIDLLKSTNNEAVDDVLDYLRSINFFKAPASAAHHLAVEGGLVQHSVNTANAALAIWEAMKPFDPDLAYEVKRENVIIAALLHDVCKSDIYEKAPRRRKNDIGQDEIYMGYKVVNSDLPIGHGEKSLVMLLYNTSLNLTNQEMMAIRYHMGPWALNFNSDDEKRQYDNANNNALVPIIYAADLMAARIIERTGE